ncbi:MAG: hypothetical protein KKH68_09745 [Proteobacteria bacterium]|nr:hypothetical protein [Pseudomonadota bacterium]
MMRYNKHFQLLLAWALIIFFVAVTVGCSTRINSWSFESIRNNEITSDFFNHDGLALLPVIILDELFEKPEQKTRTQPAPYTVEEKSDFDDKVRQKGKDAFQVILSEILLSKTLEFLPPQNIVSHNDALKRLNDKGLSQEYIRFNTDFSRIGFNESQFKQFGGALGCRYILVSQAVITEYKSDASLTIVWTFGKKSVLRTVKFYGQIWDTKSGRQIWEGSGVGANQLSAFENPPLIEELASRAVVSMLETIIPTSPAAGKRSSGGKN